MRYFILSEEVQKVKNPKTQEYLDEVISTFENGNYRSCLVTLYSVVIYDVFCKLTTLRDTYGDSNAATILSTVEREQAENPKLSEWENKLLSEVYDKTQLLTPIEKEQIEQLKKYRNWAAHPVFKNNYELVTPTKEQTLAHIRNMFEAVFLKDAILAKKVYESFLADIESFYSRNGAKDIYRFLKSRYFPGFNDSTRKFIHKNLWSLCFYQTDEQTQNSREILCQALICLTDEWPTECRNYIVLDKEYYNSKIMPYDANFESDYNIYTQPIIAFLYYLNYFPYNYNLLNDANKIEIENTFERSADTYLLSYLICNKADFFETLQTKIKNTYIAPNGWSTDYKYLCISDRFFLPIYENSKKYGSEVDLRKFIINYFINSPSYSTSGQIFPTLIQPILVDMDIGEYQLLLNGMNANSQIYELRQKNEFLSVIKNCYTDKSFSINLAIYNNL